MRVIKSGVLPTKVIEGTCSNCGCVVELEGREANTGVSCPTKGCDYHIGPVIRVRPGKWPVPGYPLLPGPYRPVWM